MAYAAGTDVPVERTRAEIERLVTKYGAAGFVSGWQDTRAMIEFLYNNKRIRFVLELPERDAFTYTSHRRKLRTPAEKEKAWEQGCRARWRALLLSIKAKLSDVEAGISTFEQSFMPNIVMPDGKTIFEHVMPAAELALSSGQMPQRLLNA